MSWQNFIQNTFVSEPLGFALDYSLMGADRA